MTTVEERMRILKMIEEGTVSAGEGANLLRALKTDEQGGRVSAAGGDKRWFHLRVTDLRSGETKLSVNIPLSLVHVGVKMGARFVPTVEGVDVDEIMTRIREGATGKLLDVADDEDQERFEIFIE